MLTFLKIKGVFCAQTVVKRSLDLTFNSEKLVESLSGIDKEAMGTLFDKRNYKHEDNQAQLFGDFVMSCGFEEHEFELVAGDIKTAYDYVKERPGFRFHCFTLIWIWTYLLMKRLTLCGIESLKVVLWYLMNMHSTNGRNLLE